MSCKQFGTNLELACVSREECPSCTTSRRLNNQTCSYISSEFWKGGRSLFCCYHAVFRGVSRWLNDGACLCIDVSVGQWSSSSQDYTEERNRALIIIFKFHSERQARVHTVEYLKEVCHWFCLGHCNFSVINTPSIKRRNHVRYSAIGKHLETQHGNNRTKTDLLFKILKKFNSKFDCLVYEMLYIKDIKPSLNTEAGSIRAKLFMRQIGRASCRERV